MTERILGRSKTSGRTDDNMESLKKRFKIFEGETRPVLDYYSIQGKLITVSLTVLFMMLKFILDKCGEQC